jgi:hypothetical protein
VLANQISGFADAGIAIGMPVRELIVKLNTVQQCGNGIVSLDDARSDSVAIENNRVSDIGRDGATAAPTTLGIGVLRAEAVSVVGNSLLRVAQTTSAAVIRAGIVAAGVRRLRASGNDIFDIGPAGNVDNSGSVGIMLMAPFVHAEVAHNQVDRETVPLFDGGGDWIALLVDGLGDERGVVRVAGYTALRADAATTIVFGSTRAWLLRVVNNAASAANFVPSIGGISVLGNALAGRGSKPVVRLAIGTDCLFNDNRCEARSTFVATSQRPAVQLQSGTAIVNANRVRGGLPSISIAVGGDPKAPPLTVVGNITTGAIDGMPAVPWAPLNVRG